MNGPTGSRVIVSLAAGAMTAFAILIASPASAATNLIANPQVETTGVNGMPLSWSKGGYGDNTRVLTYPEAGYGSAKAISAEITAYGDGDAKWYFNPVAVTSGQQLTYSDFYQSNTTSYLTARVMLQDGSYKYPALGQPVPEASSWTQVSRTFVVPTYASPVVSLTVFHQLRSVGWIDTDAFVLAESAPSSDPANLIVNAALETLSTQSPGRPAYWAGTRSDGTTATFSYPVPGKDGMGAEVDVSDYEYGAGAKWYFQTVAAVPLGGYEFADWYESDADTVLTAQILLDDGSYRYITLKTLPPADDWTEARAKFSVPANAVSLTVMHYLKAVGTLTTDEYSLTKLASSQFDAGMVSFNFDDGLSSIYDNGIPSLNAAGFKSTQYVISDAIGSSNHVDLGQIEAMQAAGHDIDGHTRTHPHLTWLSHDDMVNEVAGGKSDLEALGFQPQTFAYPFNDFNADVEQAVKDAGFRGARSARQGFNNRYTDPFALLDQHVESSVSIDQVQGWIDQAIADKTWLILEVHDVDESGSQYSITPDMLDQIIAYVRSSGISVATNSEGLTAMGS